jgi:hypothetical protein
MQKKKKKLSNTPISPPSKYLPIQPFTIPSVSRFMGSDMDVGMAHFQKVFKNLPGNSTKNQNS